MSVFANNKGCFHLTVLRDFINDFNNSMHALVRKEHEDTTAFNPSLYQTGLSVPSSPTATCSVCVATCALVIDT